MKTARELLEEAHSTLLLGDRHDLPGDTAPGSGWVKGIEWAQVPGATLSKEDFGTYGEPSNETLMFEVHDLVCSLGAITKACAATATKPRNLRFALVATNNFEVFKAGLALARAMWGEEELDRTLDRRKHTDWVEYWKDRPSLASYDVGNHIILFNDNERITYQDVLTAFEKAIKSLVDE